MEKRECLECGEPLRGRADQKFCNDLCRNAYNNKKFGAATNYMRKINRILKKNHAILKGLNPEGKTVTLKTILENHDFNFNFFTHIYTTRNGRVYYFCYDQGYAELENSKYMLVKNKEN